MRSWPFSDDNLRAMYPRGRAAARARRLAALVGGCVQSGSDAETLGDTRGRRTAVGTARPFPVGDGRRGRSLVPGVDARRAMQLGPERVRRGRAGHASPSA